LDDIIGSEVSHLSPGCVGDVGLIHTSSAREHAGRGVDAAEVEIPAEEIGAC